MVIIETLPCHLVRRSLKGGGSRQKADRDHHLTQRVDRKRKGSLRLLKGKNATTKGEKGGNPDSRRRKGKKETGLNLQGGLARGVNQGIEGEKKKADRW